jgi:hypothetical protein
LLIINRKSELRNLQETGIAPKTILLKLSVEDSFSARKAAGIPRDGKDKETVKITTGGIIG